MYVFPDVGSLIGFVVVIFASLGIVGMLLIKYYYYEKAREEERKTQMLGKVISSMADIRCDSIRTYFCFIAIHSRLRSCWQAGICLYHVLADDGHIYGRECSIWFIVRCDDR